MVKHSPEDLLPDFDNIPGEFRATFHTFWIGLTPDCPRGQIDVAGLTFVKATEKITTDHVGKQVRVPSPGYLDHEVTKEKFERLAEELRRMVIRPRHQINHDGAGENTRDPVQRFHGKLLKIPNEQTAAAMRENGRNVTPYVKQPGDRPAADFMYCVHVPEGQTRPAEYVTISEAGLEWPEAAELSEFLSN